MVATRLRLGTPIRIRHRNHAGVERVDRRHRARRPCYRRALGVRGVGRVGGSRSLADRLAPAA